MFDYYNFKFVMFANTDEDEGVYHLYFHTCLNYDLDEKNKYMLNVKIDIEEINNGNYLSATKLELPKVYSIMSMLFLIAGLLWTFVLKQKNRLVLKIHYLMGLLVYLKVLSLMLKSIYLHNVGISGEAKSAWLVLYSIAYLLKSLCLYATIGN